MDHKALNRFMVMDAIITQMVYAWIGYNYDHSRKAKEKYPNALDIESEIVPSKLKELTA